MTSQLLLETGSTVRMTWIGLDPRSTTVKVIFVVVGALHLVAAFAVALAPSASASWLALVAAGFGLWYLPFGTLANAIVILLVATTSLKPWV